MPAPTSSSSAARTERKKSPAESERGGRRVHVVHCDLSHPAELQCGFDRAVQKRDPRARDRKSCRLQHARPRRASRSREHDEFRHLFDGGNAVRVGDDLTAELALAAPHMRMMHVQDMLIQDTSRGDPTAWWPCVPLGRGEFDLPAIIDVLRRASLPAISSLKWRTCIRIFRRRSRPSKKAWSTSATCCRRNDHGRSVSLVKFTSNKYSRYITRRRSRAVSRSSASAPNISAHAGSGTGSENVC
jgi:hypothetical protein